MTLGVSAWAVCTEAAVPMSQQMACCKDGELSCAPHGSASDCCLTDAARSRDALVTGKSSVHPVTALITWNGAAALPLPVVAPSRFHLPVAPPQFDVGPPPYIAFSSLLI